jgi:VWFA-related protein
MKTSSKNALYGGVCTAFFILFLGLNLYPNCLQEKKDETTLQHEVTVTLKLIQVYVTDKKGNPVVDLGKDDFVIYDNGKQKSITEFERHILAIPSMEEEIQPQIIQESVLPAPRELMNRKFFLFFDFAYSSPRGILKAKEAALHFIDNQLQPSDEVGVLSYSALKSLTLHEYLTIDHRKIREVVGSFGLRDIHGRAENFEEEYWNKMKDQNPVEASKEGKKDQLVLNRIESLHQAANFSQKMNEFAKALRYIPGHKHILLFSSGLPYSMMYGVNLMGSEELRARFAYEDMLKELSASNSKIYSLNTEDLSKPPGGIKIRGVFSLQDISSLTGGKYLGHINSYEKHMQKIQNLTGCYYVLGYYIDEKWDGKYQKIKVKVNRSGCKVYAQKGYFNPKSFSEYTRFEKMLHLVDLALSEDPLFQTPYRFPLTTLPCSFGREMNLCLVSKIPMEKIQDILKGKVEIINIIFDADENIIELKKQEREFPETHENNVYYYSFFSLSPGEYKCRIVIRNLETGRGAVAASPAEIYERQEREIELLPPLLLISEQSALYVKGAVPHGKEAFSSLEGYFHFDSARYAPLMEEELQSGSIVSAVVPCLAPDIPEPEVTISASLIDLSSREVIPLEILTLSEAKEKELRLCFVEFRIPDGIAGEYALSFTAEDIKTSSVSEMTRIFKIK